MSIGPGSFPSSLPGTSSSAIDDPFGEDLLQFLQTNDFTVSGEDLDLFTITNSKIDPSLWYKLLPYRFLLLKASPGDQTGQTNYDIVGTYVLPIGPQNLSYNIPFASLSTPLADGMLVELNGAPLRTIEISGTTGFLPYRSTSAPSSSGFGGQTINAVTSLATTIGNLASPPGTPNADNTGYALFHKLLQFFEVWANISKDATNNNLRIAFDMPKDNVTFLVTPKSFSLIRDTDSPMLYRYSIGLEAWSKCAINGVTGQSPSLQPGNPLLNPSALAKILTTIQTAQRVINQAANILTAIRSDVSAVLNAVRQIALAIKSVLNLAANLADMPEAIVQGVAGSLGASWDNIQSGVQQASKSIDGLSKVNFQNVWNKALVQYGTQSNLLPSQTISPVGVSTSGITVQGSNPGGTISSKGTANINNPAAAKSNSNPYTNPAAQLSNILSNRSGNYGLLTAINLNSLKNIPQSVQNKIDREYATVNSFTRLNYQNVRDEVNSLSRAAAAYFGQSAPDYNKYYTNVPYKIGIKNNTLNRSQMDILIALRDLGASIDQLCSQDTNNQTSIDLSFNYVGTLLAGTGITIEESASKFQAPVPFGMSMAQISNLYLGSPERVNEIVILNNLNPPYIDEDGTTQSLLVNGTNQSFVIEDGTSLILGQRVVLSSNTVNPFGVIIKKIKKINDSEWLITIQNQISLDNLTTLDMAQVQYFIPGTVNSNNVIWIPSNNVNLANLPDRVKPITFLPNSNGLQQLSKIDLLLTTGGDLAINGSGACGLASGLPNLLQALKMKLLTAKGDNFFHPFYGAGVSPGTPISAAQIPSIKNNFIAAVQADPRFSEVLGLTIKLQNGTLFVSGTVVLASISQSLPFNFVI